MSRLTRETEGKYSGYSHHPDYKVGDDIRKKPTSHSKALEKAKGGKKGKYNSGELGDKRPSSPWVKDQMNLNKRHGGNGDYHLGR